MILKTINSNNHRVWDEQPDEKKCQKRRQEVFCKHCTNHIIYWLLNWLQLDSFILSFTCGQGHVIRVCYRNSIPLWCQLNPQQFVLILSNVWCLCNRSITAGCCNFAVINRTELFLLSKACSQNIVTLLHCCYSLKTTLCKVGTCAV